MIKLTAEQKGTLLRRARQGASSRELAAEFEISQTQAAKLVRENLPPDPKALALARLEAIANEESLPASVRLQAAEALKTSLEPQPAPKRPLHAIPPNSPYAGSVEDDWVDPFAGCESKPVPPPKPAPTPAELRAKEIARANALMKQAVESGNVAAITRLTEVFRKQGLYAPEPPVPVQQKPPLPVPPPDAGWVSRRLLLLECAVLRRDESIVSELRAELEAHGVDYPGKPKPESAPTPERPAAHLPHIDLVGMALTARRTYPAGPRVISYQQYADTF